MRRVRHNTNEKDLSEALRRIAEQLVADISWNAGVIFGHFIPPPPSPVGCTRRHRLPGRHRDCTGPRRGCARTSIRAAGMAGEPPSGNSSRLRKNDIVMTGSIVTTRFPTAPFTYRFDVAGLGSVEVSGS